MNNIEKELIELKIIDEKHIFDFFPSVRDKKNIRVKKCKQSNVIFLSENSYIDDSKYEEKKFIDYWGGVNAKLH